MAIVDLPYRSYLLDNGLQVALLQTPTKTISARLRVFHGAVHEQEGEEGLAHMLEHCVYTAGSRKHTPQQVDEIQRLLAETNAHTTLGHTSFIGNFLAEDVELFLNLTSEAVFHPLFDPAIVEQERQRVLREITDTTSGSRMRDELAFEKALLRSFPQSRLVCGKEEVVRGASIDDIHTFHDRGYHTNNIHLILVGNLPDDVDNLIQHYFADKPMGDGKPFLFPEVPPLTERTILHTAAPYLASTDLLEGGNAQLRLGFIVPPETHPDCHALIMLSEILGGKHPSSLLHQEVSRLQGLAYHISSLYDGSNNAGMIEVRGRVHAPRWEEAVQLTFDTFKYLQDNPLPTPTFERLRKRLLFSFADHGERNKSRMGMIGRTLETGISPEERYDSLTAVTPAMVRDAAQKYLPKDRDGNYVLLVRDPLKR